MNQSWNDYDRAGAKGPLALAFKIIAGLALVCAVLFGLGTICGTVTETRNVAQEQFGARAALKKYEWFKDASAQLAKKRADITLYDARQKDECKPRPTDRFAQEACTTMASERLGVIASYNELAAEYNAASSKVNWSIFQGDIPQTYAPYTTGAQ